MKFKIYAGLKGSYGGAEYIRTEDFVSKEVAEYVAFEVANSIYERHEGTIEYPSLPYFEEFYCCENGYELSDLTENDFARILERYNEEIEDAIEFYVEEDDEE